MVSINRSNMGMPSGLKFGRQEKINLSNSVPKVHRGSVGYSGAVGFNGLNGSTFSSDNGIIRTTDGKTFGITRNSEGQVISDWTRKDGEYIAKMYDSDGRVTYLHKEIQNENGETVSDTITDYGYDDSGKIINEKVYNALTGEQTVVKYDENGGVEEKFMRKGAVTTYFDADDKPIRRETNKGQGIVVTEDLSE